MNTRIVKIVGTFVGALLFVPVTPASAQMAQLYEDFGVGPRDSAMGNTGTAVANDFSAAFYNPAALVRSKGLALDFGYKGVYPQLKIKIGRYGDREFTRYPTTDLFLFGLTWNFKMDKLIDPKWTERFTVGFAFAFSDYFKSFTIYYDQDTPFFYRYHDRYLNLLPIYLSLGVRVTDWFSIGAGMVPAPSDTYTDVTVDSHITAPEYSYTATQGTVTRSYGKLEPVVGALFRIAQGGDPDYFTLGITWRDEVTTTDGNGVATDYTKLEYEGRTYPLTPSDTPILSLTGWSPMQVQAGIGWRPGAGLTLTVEELWKRWSEWENFFGRHPSPRFNDTWNTRAGAEMTFDVGSDVLKAFAVRAGGYRENSPVPDQNGQSNYIDPNKWVASAGFDLDMRDPFDVFMGPVHLGAAWQTHFMDRVTLHNRQDPDYPEIEAWGEIHSFTATLSICTQ